MANGILSISVSPCNNIADVFSANDEVLSNKLTNSFQITQSSFKDGDYPELGTIVGLGFAAVLAEGNQINTCCIHVGVYLRCRNFYNRDNIGELSHALAQIVLISLRAFKKLGYPRYYDDFLLAIHRVVYSNLPIPVEIKQAIGKLLK